MAIQLINIGSGPNSGDGEAIRLAFDKCNDNFAELYNLTPSAPLLADGSVDSTGGQLYTGHIAVGENATVDANAFINVIGDIADGGVNGTANAQVAMYFEPTMVDDSTLWGNHLIGFKAKVIYDSNPTIPSAEATGMYLEPNHSSTGGLSMLKGLQIKGVSEVGSGALSSATGAEISRLWSGAHPATAWGMNIGDMGHASTGTAIGLRIAPQTGTVARGIHLNGNAAGADIVFGTLGEVKQVYDGSYLDFSGSGIGYTADGTTPNVTGYVTISIDGTPRKFATIT